MWFFLNFIIFNLIFLKFKLKIIKFKKNHNFLFKLKFKKSLKTQKPVFPVNCVSCDDLLKGHPWGIFSIKLPLILAHVGLELLVALPFFVKCQEGPRFAASAIKASSFSRRCSRYSITVICFVKNTGYSCIPSWVLMASVKGASINSGPNNFYCTVRYSYLVPFLNTL